MPIDDPSVIDLIGIDKKTKEVVLTITDHLDWSDVDAHLDALEAKLNAYVSFIESGELYQAYPKAKREAAKVIDVVCAHRPVAAAYQYIGEVAPVVAPLNVKVRFAE